MSMDQEKYERRVYSILDLFSDIGGLFGALSPIFAGLVTVLTYLSSYQFVMSHLFVCSDSSESTAARSLEKNDVQWRSCRSLYLTILSKLPASVKCCKCLRPSRQETLRAKGLKHVLHEVSISNIIRQLRVLNAAAKQGRTTEQWAELEKKHSFIAYSDLDTDQSA